MQVVALLAEGFSPKEIGSVLSICRDTVDYHWAVARRKLGFRSYVDSVKYCIKLRLIKL